MCPNALRIEHRHGAGRISLYDRRKAATITMPSLLRFLTVIGIIFAIGYGAIYALATFVNPKPRVITVTVRPDKFVKQPH